MREFRRSVQHACCLRAFFLSDAEGFDGEMKIQVIFTLRCSWHSYILRGA